MQQEETKAKRVFNPVLAVGILVGIIAVTLLAISLANVFRKNPYGDEIKIDNFGQFFGNVPTDEQDKIYRALYQAVLNNTHDIETLPNSGALVRSGTTSYDYDENTYLYRGKFIVDIASLEQSYEVSFNWSNRKESSSTGYKIIVGCVSASLQIYAFNNCEDMYTNNVAWGNEYQLDYSFGTRTSYRIRQIVNDYIVANTEKGSHTAIIDETSLTRLKQEPAYTYSFMVKVDDTYDYRVTVRMDELYGEQYVAVLVDDGVNQKGYIQTEDEDVKNTLTDWLLGISGLGELEITASGLD